MKKLRLTTVLLFAMFVLSQKALAQSNGGAGGATSVPITTMNQAATTLRTMSYDMSLNKMIHASNWFANFDDLSNNEYDFTIKLKDTVIKAHSRIYVDAPLHKAFLVYEDLSVSKKDPRRKLKVYPDQTTIVSRVEPTTNQVVTGMPTDSCWLFKVVSGKINLYSQLSQTKGLSTQYIKAYQIGEGPVMKLDSTALSQLVKSDQKAYDLVGKNDFYKAVIKYNGGK